nr:Hpt domain-containing protein [Devosia marina]
MNISDPTETFRQEARELLEQLEAGLLDLEQDPSNADLINSTFRALHTIKGSGAMFGFTAVAGFVHEFETAFDQVRKGQTGYARSSISSRSPKCPMPQISWVGSSMCAATSSPWPISASCSA